MPTWHILQMMMMMKMVVDEADSDKDDDNDNNEEFQTRKSVKETLKYKLTYTIRMLQK